MTIYKEFRQGEMKVAIDESDGSVRVSASFESNPNAQMLILSEEEADDLFLALCTMRLHRRIKAGGWL